MPGMEGVEGHGSPFWGVKGVIRLHTATAKVLFRPHTISTKYPLYSLVFLALARALALAG